MQSYFDLILNLPMIFQEINQNNHFLDLKNKVSLLNIYNGTVKYRGIGKISKFVDTLDSMIPILEDITNLIDQKEH